ncbi:MAG: DNA alkylation repair protein [Helicobacteraceae bacterium]|jgi:3-methyladenine DNA glycosylase AlkD|nr:DNA alkylation repair protein [Helicobacteraceae bacterium]
MEYEDFFAAAERSANEALAKRMRAYMRNHFFFLGIPTPQRRSLCKELFAAAKKEDSVDWCFAHICWQNCFREFQYVAIDYLMLKQEALALEGIPKIRELAVDKSWWDTIDGLDRLIGSIALRFPQANKTILLWSENTNIWLRRIAIDCQIGRKEKTDTNLLERVIINNLGQKEFFINKAIGWSLREYSKTDPKWVGNFLIKYRGGLSNLSLKEAGKYLREEFYARCG